MIGLIQYFGFEGSFLPWVNQGRYGEAFANLRQRNQFASLTNISLSALIWFGVMFSRRRALLNRRYSRNYRAFIFLAAALLACGNAASVSRTGLIQLILLCALCAIWGQWRQAVVRGILVTAILAYAVSAFMLPRLAEFDLSTHSMFGRLSAGDSVCSSRLTLWFNVLHLIAMKPWFGWGWGELDYAHYTAAYEWPRFCEILDNAHNLPLQLAVEFGLPVALFVCAGFILWAVRKKPWLEVNPAKQMAWSVLAVILLHSMLEYPLWYGPFQMAMILCIAILLSRARWQSGNGLVRAGCGVLSASLLVGSIYAIWDYRRISQIYLAPEARDARYRTDTLEKISGSRLFSDQVLFARLLLTPLTPSSALWTFETARALLHFSPEPRVIERLIESAVMLGRDEEAGQHILRYRAAFPAEYEVWRGRRPAKPG